MVRIEISPEGHVRVIGALEPSLVRTLIETHAGRELTLDLSQVYTADGAAVRQLAELPPGRFTVFAAPPWLSVWIAHERRRRVPTSSRIHDEPNPSGFAVIEKLPAFSVTQRGHGDCLEGSPDDTEDSR